ncbi:MAG: phosphotransferase [Alphaproteobacteria bacterium]|nr:phosphotransferase [Alphaproteobacteria bacterium]
MSPERREAMNEFLHGAGWGDAVLSPLPGDASTRRYIRLHRGGNCAMLMDQPQNAEAPQSPANATPEQRRTLGYNAVARLAGADCGRFVAVADFLRARGLSAPHVFAADVKQGFVLIEDLGDDLYTVVLANGHAGEEPALYGAAIDALAKLHGEAAPAELGNGKPLHAYDETALIAETDLLTEWFVPLALGRAANEDEREEHRMLWCEALQPVLSAPPVFVHRDYHAQNLFWLPEREGAARVGMIDFQDAVAGTTSYDLISLLEDARRDVATELADAMMQRYIEARQKTDGAFDGDAYRTQAAVIAAQRNAKIAGIFARLYKRDDKPRYLSYLPRVWGYLERDLQHPALANLKRWYDRKIPAAARHQTITGAAA